MQISQVFFLNQVSYFQILSDFSHSFFNLEIQVTDMVFLIQVV